MILRDGTVIEIPREDQIPIMGNRGPTDRIGTVLPKKGIYQSTLRTYRGHASFIRKVWDQLVKHYHDGKLTLLEFTEGQQVTYELLMSKALEVAVDSGKGQYKDIPMKYLIPVRKEGHEDVQCVSGAESNIGS